MSNRKKLYHIETFRGLACLLIVWFHVIEGLVARGDVPNEIEPYVMFNRYIRFLRLPLFTFISGYVYSLNPVTAEAWALFLIKKRKRLLVPFLILSPAFFIIRAIMPSNRPPQLEDIIYVYSHPDLVFWYLLSLMWVCIALVPIELSGILRTFKSGFITILVSISCLYFLNPWGEGQPSIPFALEGAVYLLPFFLLGCWFYRFEKTLTGPRLRYFVVALLITCFSYLFKDIPALERPDLQATLISVLSLWTLFQFKVRQSTLMWIGHYSFSIFLYHMLAIPALRIVVGRLHLALPMQIIIMLLGGLIIPICIEIIAIKVIRLFRGFSGNQFYGQPIASTLELLIGSTRTPVFRYSDGRCAAPANT
jgi:peptidoglycan/LPS O-acetylase OafA/YrhL